MGCGTGKQSSQARRRQRYKIVQQHVCFGNRALHHGFSEENVSRASLAMSLLGQELPTHSHFWAVTLKRLSPLHVDATARGFGRGFLLVRSRLLILGCSR